MRSSQACGSASPPKPSSRAGAQPFVRLANLREDGFERDVVRAGFKGIDARRPGTHVVLSRSSSRSLSNSKTSCAVRDIFLF